MTLASDLAAIRARCEAYANAHAPYSEDDLWELNLTPDAVPFFLHAQSDLPRLLARLEEMRKGLERIQMAAGNADASTGCRLILAEVKRLLHPLREPG